MYDLSLGEVGTRKNSVFRHFSRSARLYCQIIVLFFQSNNIKLVKDANSGALTVSYTIKSPEEPEPKASEIKDVDCFLWAIGRNPNTFDIGLEKLV